MESGKIFLTTITVGIPGTVMGQDGKYTYLDKFIYIAGDERKVNNVVINFFKVLYL
ncbi:MAG: hypothetical protein ABI760_17330 [Ferruginibacter sp.]